MPEVIVVAVTESSQVGEARRRAASLAAALGFESEAMSKLAIVVTEAASNLVKHTTSGGTLILSPLEGGGSVGVEILALDRGPGVADFHACMRDGYSMAGTPGTGLGAIVRQSSFTDFYSRQPSGTALVARVWAWPAEGDEGPIEASAVAVAKAGEPISGDAWAAVQDGRLTLVMVADGLGHGPVAAAASRAAVASFRATARLGPSGSLKLMHEALRGSRGAAVAIASIDVDAREVRFAGVGNVAGSVIDVAATPPQGRGMVSHNGIVGHEARTFQEFRYDFPPQALLVMHSDGVSARWTLGDYAGLCARDPALVAGVLFRDNQRGRDDATVVVAREVATEAA